MSEHKYDAVVIGSGQGGSPLSTTLAGAGWKTALIEREHVGGTCINNGCTPTKTMVASARVAHLVRRGPDYGVKVGKVEIDMAKVRQRKRDIVRSFRSGSQRRIEGTEGLQFLRGEASFEGPNSLEVRLNDGGTLHLSADKIFIDTGTRPAVADIPGIENTPRLDSTSVMELDHVPQHLLVIGGGYVGIEFAQMFRRFGSDVTIVQHGRQLLGREDDDVAEEVRKILEEDGIAVHLATSPTQCNATKDGGIEMRVETPRGEQTMQGSHLLLAAGRIPNTDRLNLQLAGVKVDARGFVQVNERLETNVPGIYALGDVKGGPAFTHISYDDFRILEANLLHNGNASTKTRLVPYTVFMDPQLGRVGLTERQAKEQGYSLRVARMPMDYVARALEVDETRGFMKAVIDADTDRILGCAVLGIEGGEVMAILQMAMMGKIPYRTLRHAVFAHPTLAEALNNLFGSLEE